MARDFLGICIGNTTASVGAFSGDKLLESASVPNEGEDGIEACLQRLAAGLDRTQPLLAVTASVVPAGRDRIEQHLTESVGAVVMQVERDLPIPISRQLAPEALVGDDRLLTAAAAYDVLKQACAVVDAGTAITIDFVDGVGTYHGGAIFPGVRMMLNALHERTAQIPSVNWRPPDEPIGHDTGQAILSGAFHGARGAVRELVEQYAEVAGAYPMVVATGGDAAVLFDGYDLVERIVPDLALLGIAATVRVAGENNLLAPGGS